MNNVKELFARLFVIAFQNMANLSSFSHELARSELVRKIEANQYDDYFNKSLLDIFFDVMGNRVNEDLSFGVYNDAYWCGYSYFELHLRTQKPFAYIFLKLPLVKMVDIYSVYHEMDISSLLEYFVRASGEKTILRILCQDHNTSLPKLSFSTGISLATLSKYNAEDDSLYKASFQNVIKIAEYFDSPINLFVQRLSIKRMGKAYIEIYGDNYCGYYSKTRAACRGVITRDSSILLCYEKNTDTWMIPGGGLEDSESETDCVVREVSEEAGYIISPSKCVLEIDEYYGKERYINKYYLCEILGECESRLTEAEAEAGLEPKWIPIKEAIAIFSRYRQYTKDDEMKSGLYLREYSALRRILLNK